MVARADVGVPACLPGGGDGAGTIRWCGCPVSGSDKAVGPSAGVSAALRELEKLMKALENLRPRRATLYVVVLRSMGNCYRFVEGPRPSRDHRKTCETSTRKKDFRWRLGVGTAAGECDVILRARNKDEPMLQDKQARSQSRNNGGLRMETQELRSS